MKLPGGDFAYPTGTFNKTYLHFKSGYFALSRTFVR